MKKTLIVCFIILLSSYCYAMGGSPPKEGEVMAKGNVVVMETSKGKMRIELYADKAPLTVKNFLSYVDSGFYNGTIFHRVIPGFMIQGGGYGTGMTGKFTDSPIKNEAGNGLSNDKGTIAMARTGVVDSATSQFFINVADNSALNHRDDTPQGYGYCVFGRVIEGMNVADEISTVQTRTIGYYNDVPVDDVVIISVKRE
jgi:peptidyl-prolyl cis-trans isomerase A (cyclophilin A)